MSSDVMRFRQLVVEAVRANPAAVALDPASLARLDDPSTDTSFDELGFDSLARMELAIWLQLEAGIVVGESELTGHPSVDALAAFLAGQST